jgi:hypothetical protein
MTGIVAALMLGGGGGGRKCPILRAAGEGRHGNGSRATSTNIAIAWAATSSHQEGVDSQSVTSASTRNGGGNCCTKEKSRQAMGQRHLVAS